MSQSDNLILRMHGSMMMKKDLAILCSVDLYKPVRIVILAAASR